MWRAGETTTLYYPVGAYFQITEAQNCWRHCGDIFCWLCTPNPKSITRSLQGWRKKQLSLDQGLGKSLPTSTVLTTQMWKDERSQQRRIRPTLFLMRWFVWYPCKGRLEDLAWDCVYLVGFKTPSSSVFDWQEELEAKNKPASWCHQRREYKQTHCSFTERKRKGVKEE